MMRLPLRSVNGPVGEWTGEDEAAFRLQLLESVQMSRSMYRTLRLALGAVKSKDHEPHRLAHPKTVVPSTIPQDLDSTATFLEWLSAGVSGIDFVPPLDLVFAKLPAEVDDTAVQSVRKVTQPYVEVLHKHAHFLNGTKIFADLLKRMDIVAARGAATTKLGFAGGLFDVVFDSNQNGFCALDGTEVLFELRDEAVSLSDGKEAFEILSFFPVRHLAGLA